MQLSRREFLAWSGVALAPSAPPPNIILIVADDLGYGDLGCYGQTKIATPQLDRLAAEGMRFTSAYAGASVCAPSRCCLLTGLHTGHARVRDNHSREKERVSLRPDDLTFAEVLKRAGYATAAFGKWGIGEAGTRGVPNLQGFDEWFGFLNQDHALEYYPTHLWENLREHFPPGNQGAKREQYVQDLFTERALDFLGRNRDRPFLLYLPYTTPHSSSELGRDTGDGFVVPDYGRYADREWPRPERGYAAMVSILDADVGRIVDETDRLGLSESTLILFLSDNGPADGSGHDPKFFSSAGPFRGMKGTLYEGGLRTPAVARWPGRVPAGRVSEAAWAFWDLLPTFADLAGLPALADLDGVSVRPLLEGGSLGRRPPLYWERPARVFEQAVREGDWKALRFGGPGGRLELYDLAVDPGERRNLSAAEPQRAARLAELMDACHEPSPLYRGPANAEGP